MRANRQGRFFMNLRGTVLQVTEDLLFILIKSEEGRRVLETPKANVNKENGELVIKDKDVVAYHHLH